MVLQPQPRQPVLFSCLSSTLTSFIGSSLDTNEERNKDGIVFAPYGATLKEKGFFCLSQLTLDIFTLKDLQEWLGISAGSAMLVMQYAKQDIDDIKSGRLNLS